MSTAIRVDREAQLAELTEEHRRLDDQVRELERRMALTPAEQLEYSRLKKRKLLTKDRISRLRA
ncbi:MAG: YdcH family protein [Kofleriaceae bacterium]|nr:YdcH family protein [Myxococcales bacterium]MCB9560471.1 YdcH family protein [Kofleriaceae bacterium]MCB9571598.1 YdcH family protein [Kofleriaceae bacterium]